MINELFLIDLFRIFFSITFIIKLYYTLIKISLISGENGEN